MGWFASFFANAAAKTPLRVGVVAALPRTETSDGGNPAFERMPAPQQGPADEAPARFTRPTLGAKPVLTLVSGPPSACPARQTPTLTMRARHDKPNGNVQPSRAVRLVISGRMADVCAELERLAANEARLCTHIRH